MAWHHELRSALADLIGRPRLDREMDEEMRFHVEMETRRNVEAGMSPEAARRLALRSFGGVARFQEEVRDERGAGWFQDVGQDLRYAIRTLRRRPGFTIVAALTLALGIGATSALFGVIKAVLLTPLPYGEPERIAVVWSSWVGFERTWVSYDEYEAFQTEIPAFERVSLLSEGSVNLTHQGESERLQSARVTPDLFAVLGTAPLIGRGFADDEVGPGAPDAVVLGHGLWQRRFGGDPSIVGRGIEINGEAHEVRGVMPPGFQLPLDFAGDEPTEVWLPLLSDAESSGAIPGPESRPNGGSHGFRAIARLAPGATAEQANAQLDALVARLVAAGVYSPERQFRAFAVPVEEQVTGRVRPALLIVFGAVAFVLLIACANVAGLLLVRGEHRRRELAVRVALGAGARRIARQLLTETAVLAALGAGLGLAFAAFGVWLVRRSAPPGLPRVAEATVDPGVLAFGLVLGVLAALITGVLPAIQARDVTPGDELKEGGRAATAGRARFRWRQALVITEVALAVVLVTGAGLMIRSVSNLFAIDTGFRSENVLTMRLSTPSAWYPDSSRVAAFHAELRRRIAALPGVEEVGTARILPLASDMGDWGLMVEGYIPPPTEGTPGDWQIVTPGYFEAMGLELVAGRFLDERDAMGAPLAMVINEGFVDRYLAGREPLGTRVRVGGSPPDAVYTVVGVVKNVRHNGLTTEVKAQFYATLGQYATAPGLTARTASLVIRTSIDPTQLVAPVRSVVRELDPRLPISEVRTMEDIVARSIAAPSFAMTMLGLFALLALVLSAIGIFGIVSQIVASRSQEFGIRAALGATPGALVRMSLGTGVRQTVAGLVVGIVAALAFARVLVGLLHGVSPADPMTLAAVVGVTAVVAMLATIGPARRAGRTDPVTVLHEQ